MRCSAVCLLLVVVACGEMRSPSLSATVRADGLVAADLDHVTLWAFGPRRSDGIFVPCSVLVERQLAPDDSRLERLASVEVVVGGATSLGLDGVAPGQNRVVYVEGSTGGVVVANGCAEGVTVESGQTTSVEVTLYRVE